MKGVNKRGRDGRTNEWTDGLRNDEIRRRYLLIEKLMA